MTKRWPVEQEEYLIAHYPTEGAEMVAKALGVTVKAVQVKAQKLGVKIAKEAWRRIIHDRAAEYMRDHNPMYRADSREKARATLEARPEKLEARQAALHQGQLELQRRKVSGLERQLRVILYDTRVSYEYSVEIKPNFIVDVRIGALIIQADGDYWHGHPRFEPLTERQRKQQQRDAAQDTYLRACGYTVARIWECDMGHDTVRRILIDHGVTLPADA